MHLGLVGHVTLLENALVVKNLAPEPGDLGLDAGCHFLTQAGFDKFQVPAL